MSWGLELWDRVDAVIGQLTEDTDELASVFTRCIFDGCDGDCDGRVGGGDEHVIGQLGSVFIRASLESNSCPGL